MTGRHVMTAAERKANAERVRKWRGRKRQDTEFRQKEAERSRDNRKKPKRALSPESKQRQRLRNVKNLKAFRARKHAAQGFPAREPAAAAQLTTHASTRGSSEAPAAAPLPKRVRPAASLETPVLSSVPTVKMPFSRHPKTRKLHRVVRVISDKDNAVAMLQAQLRLLQQECVEVHESTQTLCEAASQAGRDSKIQGQGPLCATDQQSCIRQVSHTKINEIQNSARDKDTFQPGKKYFVVYPTTSMSRTERLERNCDENMLQSGKQYIIVYPNKTVTSKLNAPDACDSDSDSTRHWVVSPEGTLTEVSESDRVLSTDSNSPMQKTMENCCDIMIKSEVDQLDWMEENGLIEEEMVDTYPQEECRNVIIKTEVVDTDTDTTEVTDGDIVQEWRANIGLGEALCDMNIKTELTEVGQPDWAELTDAAHKGSSRCVSGDEHCDVEVKTEVGEPDATEGTDGVQEGNGCDVPAEASCNGGNTGVKPYLCTTCGRSYTHSRSLSFHERSHSAVGVVRHRCTVCNKLCISRSDLRIHELSHATKEPYTCVTCGVSCVDFGSFQTHKLSHSGAKKQHSCSACSRSFGSRAGLKYHELLHRGDKCFSCDVCESSFITKTALKKHAQKCTRGQSHHVRQRDIVVKY